MVYYQVNQSKYGVLLKHSNILQTRLTVNCHSVVINPDKSWQSRQAVAGFLVDKNLKELHNNH